MSKTREYRVDRTRHSHVESRSELANVGTGAASHSGAGPGSAPIAPASNQAMIDLLGRREEGMCTEVDNDEATVLDSELIEQARGSLRVGFGDWVVSDSDARSTLSILQNADPEQQGLLVQALRESGDLNTLLAELPSEDLEALGGTLGAYLTSDRIASVMNEAIVTDGEAGDALDLLTRLPAEQQASALLEMSATDFSEFMEQLPDSRRSELADAMGAMADPDRRLQLWGVVAAGQAQEAHDASMEEGPDFLDRSTEAGLVRHRNSQRDSILSSTTTEVEEEMEHLREEVAAGNADLDDVLLLERRKSTESRLEQDYGVNLTNDVAGSLLGDAERRVWSEAELAALEGALQRMPAEHVRDNTAFNEVRRVDVKRANWFSDPNAGVGADAGSGLIRFYDTGTDFAGGVNNAGEPWRTDTESELSGHDAHDTGSAGSTHLIQEVLSHEIGHTVHQGDSQLEADFHALSGWDTLGTGWVGESAKDRMIASGMSEAEADRQVQLLDDTREDYYATRHQVEAGDDLITIDPYGSGYRAVERDAIPGRDEDPDGDWGYAASNPSDHFAELYTKAIHAPESVYRDLIEAPQVQVDSLSATLEGGRSVLEASRGTLSDEEVALFEEDIRTTEDLLRRAQHAADLRRSQHEFMRERVFGTDDSAIQALEAPAGKEAVYEEYQGLAAQCMTPQQLEALTARFEGRL